MPIDRNVSRDGMRRAGHDEVIHRNVEKVRPEDVHGRDPKRHGYGDHDPPPVRPQILHQPPRELRVVELSEFFFFAEIAHSRSSSSSSNCF